MIVQNIYIDAVARGIIVFLFTSIISWALDFIEISSTVHPKTQWTKRLGGYQNETDSLSDFEPRTCDCQRSAILSLLLVTVSLPASLPLKKKAIVMTAFKRCLPAVRFSAMRESENGGSSSLECSTASTAARTM